MTHFTQENTSDIDELSAEEENRSRSDADEDGSQDTDKMSHRDDDGEENASTTAVSSVYII